MTLPDRMWEALRLDPATVAARARFYRAYTELEEAPFDVGDVAELLRHGPIEGDPRVINLLGPDAHALGERLKAARRPGLGEPWVRIAEVADALRNAAIAELLLDTRAGRTTLFEAGNKYRQLGLPFGDFLVVTATGDRERSIASARQLDAVLSGRSTRGAGLLGNAATLAPVQQRYLLFAAASEADDLIPKMGDAPLARSAAAVGVTAQPLSTWWRLGTLLSRLQPRREETRRSLARNITRLAKAHGRQLRLAAADEHHWSTGRARTDLIDLDLAGAMAISLQIMDRRNIRPWRFDEDFPPLSPLARISLEIGVQLGNGDPPGENYFVVDPPHPSLGPAGQALRQPRSEGPQP